jgi:hypothetical protein
MLIDTSLRFVKLMPISCCSIVRLVRHHLSLQISWHTAMWASPHLPHQMGKLSSSSEDEPEHGQFCHERCGPPAGRTGLQELPAPEVDRSPVSRSASPASIVGSISFMQRLSQCMSLHSLQAAASPANCTNARHSLLYAMKDSTHACSLMKHCSTSQVA